MVLHNNHEYILTHSLPNERNSLMKREIYRQLHQVHIHLKMSKLDCINGQLVKQCREKKKTKYILNQDGKVYEYQYHIILLFGNFLFMFLLNVANTVFELKSHVKYFKKWSVYWATGMPRCYNRCSDEVRCRCQWQTPDWLKNQ